MEQKYYEVMCAFCGQNSKWGYFKRFEFKEGLFVSKECLIYAGFNLREIRNLILSLILVELDYDPPEGRTITIHNLRKFKEKDEKEEQTKDEEVIKAFQETYPKIISVLKKYVDLREDYYNIIALWVLGTYIHKTFPTYPYLFFNAMKGSGKTRLLNIISHIVKNGERDVSLSDAVLFRTAGDTTFCIDELENIGRKEQSSLRELLNAAYKQGVSVKRVKKSKSKEGETYEVEKFEVFTPICMANIWGMEDVLSDRCITLILEKSSNSKITKLMEVFDTDNNINYINNTLSVVSAVALRVSNIKQHQNWNTFILEPTTIYNNNYTNTTHTTHNTNYINVTFFEKVNASNLDGRHLELFFPLLIIANFISNEVLNETMETSEKIVKEKKEEDISESRDVVLLDFISRKEESNDFILINDLTKQFREFLKEDDEESKWANSKWVGRALKRLALLKFKRRVGKGREVVINFEKARKKILMFRDPVDIVFDENNVVDIVDENKPKSTKEKIIFLIEKTPKNDTNIDLIFEELLKKGLAEDDIEKQIEQLKQEGVIFEPVKGRLMLV